MRTPALPSSSHVKEGCVMHLCLALRGETQEPPGLTDKPVSSGKSELWVQEETLSQNTRLENDILTYENVYLYTHVHTLTHEVINNSGHNSSGHISKYGTQTSVQLIEYHMAPFC